MPERTCSIEGCDRGGKLTRGMCATHYKRWLRHRDPEHQDPRIIRNVAQVKAKALIKDDHWLWPQMNWSGYAKASIGGKTVALHCWVYEQAIGPVPKGLEIDHTCRIRNCVNPDHLEAVTGAENRRRARVANGVYETCSNGHPRVDFIGVQTDGRTVICRECNRQRRRKKMNAGVPSNATHGTCTTYNLGCRCDECRQARRDYDRDLRARRRS